MSRRARFAPRGPVGITPEAFGFFFDLPDPPKNQSRDGVAVVSIRGPLEHHEHWLFDSYDAIGLRAVEALESKPRALVLSIDSPGGLVAGCFELAAELQALCGQAGVPLYAYVDGQATSAAYALACAAERIVAPASAVVGSIGVLAELFDETAAAEKWGVKAQVITSGARKADGHPLVPTTDGAVAAVQALVDAQARIFFEHVAGARGLSPDDVASLEAARLTAAPAMGRGLIDQVSTLDQFLAAIASGALPDKETTMPKQQEKTEPVAADTKASKSYEDAIAALRKCAAGDDEEAAKAKRMLQAELADDAPPAEDEPGEDKPAEDEGKAAPAAAVSPASLTALAEEVHTLKKEREDEKRTALLAGYPHVDAAMKAVVATMPLAQAKLVLDAIPKPPIPTPAAAATVTATRGEGQGPAGSSGSPEAHEIDVAMGLKSPSPGIRRQGNAMVFGVISVEDARERLKPAPAK